VIKVSFSCCSISQITTPLTEHEQMTQRKSKTADRVLRVQWIVIGYFAVSQLLRFFWPSMMKVSNQLVEIIIQFKTMANISSYENRRDTTSIIEHSFK
jgi:hypothetical protein